jgi:hypothetical protein
MAAVRPVDPPPGDQEYLLGDLGRGVGVTESPKAVAEHLLASMSVSAGRR